MTSGMQGTLDGWVQSSSRPSHTDGNQPQPPFQSSTTNHETNKPSGSSSTSSKKQGNGHVEGSNAISEKRAQLVKIARETQLLLPDILADLPHLEGSKSERMLLHTTGPLGRKFCPRLGKTYIHVVPGDSFNVALRVRVTLPANSGRVAVLNMASHSSPGGGWTRGAMAQEEALCYRSSLSLTLHRRYYPWKQKMGLYSPDVVIIRDCVDSGHKLMLNKAHTDAAYLPVVSVISIAALNRPPLKKIRENTPGGLKERDVFERASDRVLTKEKMRLCLRIAARKGHRSLVLGALGCGAFKNPVQEVAECWLEVLREDEFKGGWWDGIWFAIYDGKGEGNFDIFERVLSGQEI